VPARVSFKSCRSGAAERERWAAPQPDRPLLKRARKKKYNQFQEIAPQQERTARNVKEIQSVLSSRTATRKNSAKRKRNTISSEQSHDNDTCWSNA
jgi:hypothetical protein